MKVKMTKGRTASHKDIAKLQNKIGEPLISEFLEFVKDNDGAEPAPNIFKVGEMNDSGVNGFIPVKEIVREISYIENLPNKSFPVAWAEGGDYVFVNQAAGGAVFFWDHEQPDDVIKLANGFQLFLEMLEPFDINSVKLEPGQVEKAWIDPDFLKGLES